MNYHINGSHLYLYIGGAISALEYASRVQISDEAVYVLLRANANRKGMNPSIPSLTITAKLWVFWSW